MAKRKSKKSAKKVSVSVSVILALFLSFFVLRAVDNWLELGIFDTVKKWVSDTVQPVSYTHLDVYKRQPDIPLQVSSLGFVRAEYRSDFSSAGVNQTRHRIIIMMTATVNVYVPFYAADFTVTRDFLIAETILVGEVPEALIGNNT